MIFTESEMASYNNINNYTMSSLNEAFYLLNNAVYVSESESISSPISVPVVENSRLNMYTVHFSEVDRISDENSISFGEAVYHISEANGIDSDNICVIVPEWEILKDPSIVNEMENIVVSELPEYDVVGYFTESCLNAWLETGDERYIEGMLGVYLCEGALNKNFKATINGKEYAFNNFRDAREKLAKMAGVKINDQGQVDQFENNQKKIANFNNMIKIAQAAAYQAAGYTKDTSTGKWSSNATVAGGLKVGRYKFVVSKDGKNIEKIPLDSAGKEAGQPELYQSIDNIKRNKKYANMTAAQIASDLTTNFNSGRTNFGTNYNGGGDRGEVAAKTAKQTYGTANANDPYSTEHKNAFEGMTDDELDYRKNGGDNGGDNGDDNSGGDSNSPQVQQGEKFLEKVKRVCWNKPRDFIYRQIAKIRQWADKMEKSTDTGVWHTIKKMVAKVLRTLTSWANDAKVNSAAIG